MIVGLDIGSKLIKAAVLGGTRRRPRLVKFVTLKTPQGGPEEISTALDSFFLAERLPRDRVYTALRAQDTVLREITVPFVQDEAIRRTIKFEAENAFHGAAVENMVVDYHKISSTANKSRLLVVGVHKKPLGALLDNLASAKIDPAVVGLDLGALYNAAMVSGAIPESGTVIVVDVGATSVRVLIVEDRMIRAARSIRLQANLPAVQAPEVAALPEPAQPEPEPEEEEEADTEAVEPPIQPDEKAIARIVAEISRTIIGCHLKKPVREILATGGGPGATAIVAAAAKKLFLEAKDLDFGQALGAEGRGPGELGAVAIGMGIVGLGRDPAGMDFRQEEFRYQRAFDKARRGLATAVCVLFLGLIFFSWTLQKRNEEYDLRIRIVQKSQVELVGVMFPLEPLSGANAWEIIKKKRTALEKRFEGKDTEIRSTVHDFRTLSEALAAAGGGLDFTQIRLMQKSSRLEGEADDASPVFKLREELNKNESMTVASPNISNLENGKVKFTIDIEHKKD